MFFQMLNAHSNVLTVVQLQRCSRSQYDKLEMDKNAADYSDMQHALTVSMLFFES